MKKPTKLLSRHAAEAAATPHARHTAVHNPFAWPAPPLACYPAAGPITRPERCEVETCDGELVVGYLTQFDPVGHSIRLRTLPEHARLTLSFGEFRRLRLVAPVMPEGSADNPSQAALLAERPALLYRFEPTDGRRVVEGLTVGHVQTDYGLFLFDPIDIAGTVRRSFVPRPAYAQLRVGKLTGEALVDEHLVTTEEVRNALEEQQLLRTQRLGELLLARHILTPEQLATAIDEQHRMPMVRIGEALTTLGYISAEQLADALAQQRNDRAVPLGELLVRQGLVSRQDLHTALARKMGYPVVDPVRFQVDAEAVGRLPYTIATRRLALPLMMHGGRLVVALEDPTVQQAIDEIEFTAQAKVVPVLAREGTLLGAIEAAYAKVRSLDGQRQLPDDPGIPLDFDPGDAPRLLSTLEQQHGDDAAARAQDNPERPIEQSDNSLVRLINAMIMEAQAQQASDIHIELPGGQDKVRIRFRRDGKLRPYMELPHTYRSVLVARLKIMCDLDISERRKPQDGKISFGRFVPGARLELRMVTIPTSNGLEDVVLRLLSASKPIALERLGLSVHNLQGLKSAIERPHGLFLCVGPTGSGKTTTLHAALGHLNTPERKVWTAEDPIEITQAGLRQIQVNAKIDWGFAKALRALLRADPDVVMVGEIRDKETASTAIEASLTGHLVLSTLHTNSAAKTVTRLLDMGMDPFNFADALNAVLAQRLVRKLCIECRQGSEAGKDELDTLAHDYLRGATPAAGAAQAEPWTIDALTDDWRRQHGNKDGRITLYRAVGCPHCHDTGYAGRAGIHELLTVTSELRELIQTGRPSEVIQQQAMAQGMLTLRQDGITKALAGTTTLDEVRGATA